MGWDELSDNALLKTIGDFVRHHRLNQNKTQKEVAKEAGLSRSTLSLLERGEQVTLGSLLRVLRVLDLLYVLEVFQIQKTISPILLAKEEKRKRYRARKTSDISDEYEVDW